MSTPDRECTLEEHVPVEILLLLSLCGSQPIYSTRKDTATHSDLHQSTGYDSPADCVLPSELK